MEKKSKLHSMVSESFLSVHFKKGDKRKPALMASKKGTSGLRLKPFYDVTYTRRLAPPAAENSDKSFNALDRFFHILLRASDASIVQESRHLASWNPGWCFAARTDVMERKGLSRGGVPAIRAF